VAAVFFGVDRWVGIPRRHSRGDALDWGLQQFILLGAYFIGTWFVKLGIGSRKVPGRKTGSPGRGHASRVEVEAKQGCNYMMCMHYRYILHICNMYIPYGNRQVVGISCVVSYLFVVSYKYTCLMISHSYIHIIMLCVHVYSRFIYIYILHIT